MCGRKRKLFRINYDFPLRCCILDYCFSYVYSPLSFVWIDSYLPILLSQSQLCETNFKVTEITCKESTWVCFSSLIKNPFKCIERFPKIKAAFGLGLWYQNHIWEISGYYALISIQEPYCMTNKSQPYSENLGKNKRELWPCLGRGKIHTQILKSQFEFSVVFWGCSRKNVLMVPHIFKAFNLLIIDIEGIPPTPKLST